MDIDYGYILDLIRVYLGYSYGYRSGKNTYYRIEALYQRAVDMMIGVCTALNLDTVRLIKIVKCIMRYEGRNKIYGHFNDYAKSIVESVALKGVYCYDN